jgi:hypothetical protein
LIFLLELFHHHGIDTNAPEDTFVDKRKIVKASHAAYKPNDAEKWQSRILWFQKFARPDKTGMRPPMIKALARKTEINGGRLPCREARRTATQVAI